MAQFLAKNFLLKSQPLSYLTFKSFKIIHYALPVAAKNKLIHLSATYGCQKKLEAPIADYERIKKLTHRKKIHLIDVRNPEELKEEGKIPTSENIPVDEMENALSLKSDVFLTKYKFSKPDINDEIYVYCRSGKRSTNASEILLKANYKNVWNYTGSWNEWSEKNPGDKVKS